LGVYAGFSILIENIKGGNYFNQFGLAVVMPAVFMSLICYSFYFYISKSPRIEVSKRGIKIGKETIDFAEIDRIKVRSRHKTYFLIFPYDYVEASSVILKSGKEYIIFIEHYWNGNLIRVNLNNLGIYLRDQTSHFNVTTSSIIQEESQQFYLEDFQEYRQPPYKFFNYYIFLPFILSLVYIVVFLDAPFILRGVSLLLAIGFYFVLVQQSHYFLLSENLLIVKNYLFPWKKKSFLIRSIYHVTTEHQPKQEVALKIITTDFRIYRYQSGLMNDSMLRDLIRNINIKKKVRL